MPIDPTNPNDPNQPDLSKLLNFDEVRKSIDNFFNEMLQQLQKSEPEVKQTFSAIEASGKKAFEGIGKESEKAFGKAEKAALKAEKAAEKALDSYREKAKAAYSVSGYEKAQAALLTIRRKEEEVLKKEAKTRFDAEMRFLKTILSKEEFAIKEITAERDELMQHIEDEYIEKKSLISAEIRDEKQKVAALMQLDKERESRRASLRRVMSEKEKKAKDASSPMAGLQSVLSPSAIMGRAKTDIMSTLATTLSKFSSVATVLGGVSVILLKLFGAAQAALIREGRQGQLSFATTGKVGTGIAERAFENIRGFLAPLGKDVDDVQEYLNILGTAPDVIREVSEKGGSSLAKLTHVLGGMGVTADETAQLVARASQDWGMSIDDLLSVQQRASAFNKLTGLTTNETINSFLNLNSQLRKVTSNTRDAATLMALTGKKPSDFGAREFQSMQGKLADAIAMPLQDMLGAFSFVHGRLPTFEEQKKLSTQEGGGGMTKLFFDKLSAIMEGDFESELAPIKLKQLVPSLDTREIFPLLESLKKYNEGGMKNQTEIDAFVKQQEQTRKAAEELEKEGRMNLQKQVSVASNLTVAINNLFNEISKEMGLTKGIWSLVQAIHKIPGMGPDRQAPQAQPLQVPGVQATQYKAMGGSFIPKSIPNHPPRSSVEKEYFDRYVANERYTVHSR